MSCADVCPAVPSFFPLFYTTETCLLLNLSLCPADQLRDSHVLPVQNVSIQELQAQLEQETRIHREEQEKFTERIIQVNTKSACWVTHDHDMWHGPCLSGPWELVSWWLCLFDLIWVNEESGSWGNVNSSLFCCFESGFSAWWREVLSSPAWGKLR